ncbi:MAG: hypothetical protein ACREQ5_29950, partial [Candidatus Dormibacteria bacterium]
VKYGVSYNSLMKWKAGPEAAKEHQRGRSDDGAAMEQAVDAIKKVLGVIKRTEKMRRQLKKML